MGWLKAAALAAALGLAASGPVAAAQEAAPELTRDQLLTRAQVIADLEFFRDQYAPRERAYTDATRAEMARFINAEIASARPMRVVDLVLVMSRAMAFTDNNHTRVNFFREVGSYTVAPISFWWFPEGAIVTRAHPDQRDLLGARIVSVGGVRIERARERVRPYIPGTDQTALYMSVNWLRRMEVLRHLGLSDGVTARFVFVLADGRRVTRNLTAPPQPADAARYPDPAQYSNPWRASMVPGRGPEPWPHVLEQLPQLPLYAQNPAGLTATEIDDDRVLYVRSNAIGPIGDERPIESRSYTILNDAVRDGVPPTDVIVDVRYNEGGNFLSIMNLVDGLTRMTPPNGRIYVITGRGTNSAAIVLAALLKGRASERTKFVGEHPSDLAHFWSEGDDVTTPAGLSLHYTDGFHDWGEGCTELARCYWPVVFHGVAIGDLEPDISVDMTYAQFAAGADPALDAALADLTRFRAGQGRP